MAARPEFGGGTSARGEREDLEASQELRPGTRRGRFLDLRCRPQRGLRSGHRPKKSPIPVEDFPTEAAEPWDEEGAWTSWHVSQALRTLPLEQQKVIELAYVIQMTQSEIAQTLGIPLGTVKTRLYAALRKLRGSLGDLGVVEELPT